MALLISLVAVVAADVLAILLSCCDVPGSVAFNVILEFFEKKNTKWELRRSISWFVWHYSKVAVRQGKKEPLFFRE